MKHSEILPVRMLDAWLRGKGMRGLVGTAVRWQLRTRCREYIWHPRTLDSGRTVCSYDLCDRRRFHRGECRV